MLRKMVRFLEAVETKQTKSEHHQKLADKLDSIFFWLYFIFSFGYLAAMTIVLTSYECKVNHFEFWN